MISLRGQTISFFVKKKKKKKVVIIIKLAFNDVPVLYPIIIIIFHSIPRLKRTNLFNRFL